MLTLVQAARTQLVLMKLFSWDVFNPNMMCPFTMQKTVSHLLEIQRTQNVYFNEEIMAHKKFRNPCFLTKMSAHFGIDEFGTELTPPIYNPHSLGKEDYSDCLRVDRSRRASTSQISAPGGAPGVVWFHELYLVLNK